MSLKFWLLIGQNEQFEDIMLGSGDSWGPEIIKKEMNQQINQQWW